MNTTRNRAAVLAQFLRAATEELRVQRARRSLVAVAKKENALRSIEAVAEELEAVAAHPDPDGDR